MVRGYTTIEQSCKLIELGLDKSTADMYYREWKRATKDIRIAHVGKAGKEDLPAWSLTALLELIPLYTLEQTTDGKVIAVSEIGQYSKCSEAWDNPIDAAFEIVCYLIDKNVLK